MSKKTALQNMYDNLPDNDTLLDFDAFLIGDGSANILNGVDKRVSKSRQLIGVNSAKDLKNFAPTSEFKEVINDIDEFSGDFDLFSSKEVLSLFLSTKKNIFEHYGYLAIKSKKIKGRPVLEKDLVVSKDDHYLLSYLVEKELNEPCVIKSLAELLAYKELGVLKVIFRECDGCALCKAYDSNRFDVDYLISKFSSEGFIVHKHCTCDFIPIFMNRKVFSERFQVDIDSVYVEEVLVQNFLKEFEVDLFKYLPNLSYKKVKFIDFTKFDDWSVDVVREEGDTLLIHNDYIRGRSPVDYLVGWLDRMGDSSDFVNEDFSDLDVYYLDGCKVIEKDGNYIDIDTGKVVSVI